MTSLGYFGENLTGSEVIPSNGVNITSSLVSKSIEYNLKSKKKSITFFSKRLTDEIIIMMI